jgi:hypothetical protein
MPSLATTSDIDDKDLGSRSGGTPFAEAQALARAVHFAVVGESQRLAGTRSSERWDGRVAGRCPTAAPRRKGGISVVNAETPAVPGVPLRAGEGNRTPIFGLGSQRLAIGQRPQTRQA